MDTKYILFVILFIILFTIIYYCYYNRHYPYKNNIEWNPISKTHILFTRYKETDMTYALKPFINKKNTTIFIYNKGNDIPLGIPYNAHNIKIIKTPNLGWDSYGYLYHVIKNYDNLPDYIYTLHASIQYLDHKRDMFKDILDKKHNCKYYYGGTLIESKVTFYLDKYKSSCDLNRLANPNEKYSISSNRPFNKWFSTKIGKIPDFAVSGVNLKHNYGGMFFVHKSRILKYPISLYISLFNEISVWQSEVNHYLERSWYVLYNNP